MKTKDIRHRFKGVRIIVVGDVMLDVYLRGTVNRISPEAPVPVVNVEEKDERLGGAANVALNLKSLGAIPILCSVAGHDESASTIRNLLKVNKLPGHALLSSPGRVTSVKTRVLSRNHQMLRYDQETTEDIDREEEKRLLSHIKKIIISEKPAALIFEDYNKGVLTPSLIRATIALCRKHKVLTAVDPKKKNFFAYQHIDLFKPNLREIREALNIDISHLSPASLKEVALLLMKHLAHKVTLITLSESGIFYHSKSQSGIIPAHKRDISDVSGAGDTVISVITLCLATGIPLAEAAGLANMAGGLVCEYPGVVPITFDMLERGN